MTDDSSAEKVARNNAAFRQANEGIAAVAADQGLDDGREVPFICECSEIACSTVLTIPLDEYREIRANPRRFVHAPGHEEQIDGAIELVANRTHYVVVEKLGRAAEIATRLAETAGEE